MGSAQTPHLTDMLLHSRWTTMTCWVSLITQCKAFLYFFFKAPFSFLFFPFLFFKAFLSRECASHARLLCSHHRFSDLVIMRDKPSVQMYLFKSKMNISCVVVVFYIGLLLQHIIKVSKNVSSWGTLFAFFVKQHI